MNKITHICYHAGCNIYDVEKFNEKISWHNDSDVFKGTRSECLKEKAEKEAAAYRFDNCLPHLTTA